MDPITHGITGSLLGQGLFSERQGRVATFAATLGAVFPDVDIVAEMVSRDPLAIVRYHRAITHSFVALPFFAALLAWGTRRIATRRGIESPSWAMLTLIYGVGMASHILLDGTTSFGTRMLTPFSQKRVAWDLMFIIDFVLSSCVLIPQVLAWVYSGNDERRSKQLATRMWIAFSIAGFAVWGVAQGAGYPFHVWIVGLVSAILAALFFLPGTNGWGLKVKHAAWSQVGISVTLGYIALCIVAHHSAITKVETFARENHLNPVRIGALPVPPSLLDWGDVVRTDDGVYQARFDLRSAEQPNFYFVPDSPPNHFIDTARELPEVQLYWGFARFPTIRYFADGDYRIVDFSEHRFTNGNRRSPQPFSYRVILDTDTKVVEEGWLQNGMFMQLMRQMQPARQKASKEPTP
jgi:membrane-bound metal-dependent hydrolase YbcI (DUF457 family)